MTITVTLSGPFFSPARSAIVQKMLHDITRDVTTQTERVVRAYGEASFRYQSSPPTGRWMRSVHSDTHGNEGVVDDGGIVYGPWLEGVGSRNATTRFKGYRMWRRAYQTMDRSGALGIAQPIADRAVRELNG